MTATPSPTNYSITRRKAVAGGASAALLLAVGLRHPGSADAASACTTLTPTGEIGPFFIEEKLNRSNIVTDPTTGVAVSGVPLTLSWTFLDESNSCAPLQGAQVDIWHADPNGLYSDESSEGTSGKKYLRGYQTTDASGKVTFQTIFPGWYSGRTVHIHARIRMFDTSGKATYDFLTQMFFDESIISAVYAVSPYSSRKTRDTSNASDRVYTSEAGQSAPNLMTLTGNTTDGYAAAFTFGLAPGTSSSSSSSSGSSSSGSPASTSSTSPTSSTKWAGAGSVKITTSPLGTRRLAMSVTVDEQATLTVRLLRGSKKVKTKKTSLAKGSHALKLTLPSSLAAGRITVDMTFSAADGRTLHVSKIRKVPTA